MTMKKLDSVAGTKLTARSSKIGTQATSSGAIVLTQKEAQGALDVLCQPDRQPSSTNLNLLSSLAQHGVLLEPEFTSNYEVKKFKPTLARDINLDDCRRMIEMAMVPMPVADMEKALLTSMMLMTKSPGDTAEDCAMRCKLYASQMQDWPADCFNYTLKVVTRHHKWWPAFSDFYKEYSWIVRPRLKMKECLSDLT